MKRPYRVTVRTEMFSEILVDSANSPEEAEVIAEAMLEEGETGDVLDRNSSIEDVEPVDVGGLGEIVRED